VNIITPATAAVAKFKSNYNRIERQQLDAEATWTGTCNTLPNITQPTLVIVGTDDAAAPNSLTLAERIPGLWLIRIREVNNSL
jgi:pimeloyl-ACP methyl ester carboxylesterase